MLKNFIKNYYKLFDEKLGNGTVIVLIITFLITGVGNITNAHNGENNSLIKTSINEFKVDEEIIKINGKTYKLID